MIPWPLWFAVLQRLGEAAVPSWDRLLVIVSTGAGWAVAITLFFWKIGVSPIRRDILGISRRTTIVEKWQERVNERWRQGDLSQQRIDQVLEAHAQELGEVRSEMRGVREHIDDVKVDIMGAIQRTAEERNVQFREMRDRLKDVEVTIRERAQRDGGRE